jgi:hypothetical protein
VYANPVGIHPTHAAALVVVIIASLLLEVFVTTGVLLFLGISAVPAFFVLVIGNAVSYMGVLLPLYSEVKSVLFVEIVIVLVEAGFIKLFSCFQWFQGASFAGLKWRYAFLAAIAGNACSYYFGTLIASSPAV